MSKQRSIRLFSLPSRHRSLVGKWTYKVRRFRFPRPMKHMAAVHRDFHLCDNETSPRGFDVIWRDKVVGKVNPPEELRNREDCQCCFVICTGPSLDQVDLSQLAEKTTFGVNGAILKFNSFGISPSYYTITDPDFFENRFHLVEMVIRSGARCFFSPEGLSVICQRKPELLSTASVYLSEIANHRYGLPRLPVDQFDQVAASDHELQLHRTVRLRDDGVGFSRNVRKGLFCGRTIGFRAIQLAYYLGFRRTFLLGLDLKSHGKRIRFYEDTRSARPSMLDRDYEDYILPSFEIVSDIRRQEGFEVYNLSADSRLPASVVPKLAFREALELSSQSSVACSDFDRLSLPHDRGRQINRQSTPTCKK